MNEEQKPATVSFSRAKQTLAAAPPQPQSTAVVPAAAAPGALTTPGNPAQGLVGEFDSSDLKKPPVLKYVTGNAELATENPEWANKFVWDGAICFGAEVVVIPTRVTKTYREKRPYPDNNPTPPASFKTKAEADASGLPIVDVGLVEFLIELTKEQAESAPAQANWVPEASRSALRGTPPAGTPAARPRQRHRMTLPMWCPGPGPGTGQSGAPAGGRVYC